jgi:hypothetical protein
MNWADDDGGDESWWEDPPLGELAKPSSSSSSKPIFVPNTGPTYWQNRAAIDQQLVEAIDRLAVDDTVDRDMTYVADWENDAFENDASSMLTIENTSVTAVEVVDSLWTEEPAMKLGPDKPLCIAHGRICNKGICQEYSSQLRKQKREEEQKAREAKEAKKNKKKGKGDGSVCGKQHVSNANQGRMTLVVHFRYIHLRQLPTSSECGGQQ